MGRSKSESGGRSSGKQNGKRKISLSKEEGAGKTKSIFDGNIARMSRRKKILILGLGESSLYYPKNSLKM
jgi:hypothetical protein